MNNLSEIELRIILRASKYRSQPFKQTPTESALKFNRWQCKIKSQMEEGKAMKVADTSLSLIST